MTKKLSRYKRMAFLGMIVTALGIVFSTTLGDQVGALGIVFVAVGGLLLITAMSLKRKDGGSARKNGSG